MDESQRFTGAYNPQGTLGDKPGRVPNRLDTTIFLPASGQQCTFKPGDIIDNSYELLRLLGRGGMGIVFSCRHTTMDKEYAIKLLSEDQLTPESWSRFQAEAKALARLNHPGIIGIHNMGIHARLYPYYVMDLLQGETLDELIERNGKLPSRQALQIFIQVTDALSSAHTHGIVHRDIKPSNLMLERDPRNHALSTKLMDFGIARLTIQEFARQSQTATGLIFGTPYYMSPEQCQGQRVDERSDIYSLGCTLFETLTGVPPLRGENSFQTFMLHQTAEPPSLASVAPDANFTDALETVVRTMLKKNPDDRYQTMLQVQHDLERVAQGKTVQDQGLVTATPSLKSQKSNQFDNNPKTALALKIIATATLLAIGGWALMAFVITPRLSRAKYDTELAKNKAPADTLQKLKQTVQASTEQLQKIELKAERDQFNKDPRAVYTSFVTEEDLVDHGISAEEFEETTKFSYRDLGEDNKTLTKSLNRHVAQAMEHKTPFRKTAPPGFQFFDDVSIGALQINKQKAVLATGFVPAPENAHVCLFLETATGRNPYMLDLFGPDDITGVEIVSPYYRSALDKFKKWHRLKKLSLFNTLLKAPLMLEVLDECALIDEDLPVIDQFSTITTLGLCGRKITTPAILNMTLLSKINTLMLKSIANIDSLLDKIADRDNIKELWLVNEGMTDQQLEPLTKMKNLETLQIFRSPLTPESYKYFARMPRLKNLILSTSWAPDEQEKFKANLPKLQIKFQRSTDLSYWVLLPHKAKAKAN